MPIGPVEKERTRRADDKRNAGLGDNVRFTVPAGDGAGNRLFNNRTRSEKNGRGRKSL